MLENLSLDEAIELFSRNPNPNKERNHDRKQIAEWLRELKDARARIEELEQQIADNDFNDYDPDADRCYECSGYGDDYYVDENGELVSACDDCPFNGHDPYDD